MDATELLVINQRKDRPVLEAENLTWLQELLTDSFSLGTCLRRVWVTRRTPVLEKILHSWAYREQVEVHAGADAYCFLLSVASGLESAIPGETDVFGQIKEAWKKYETSDEALLRDLRPWMQKVFEDVKEVRSRYLQGTGGSSYGSVTRMLLGQDRGGPLFLLGAGQMARSVVPYLLESELWVWNRTLSHISPLLEKIQASSPSASVRVLGASKNDELEGWKTAQDVVLCIPADATLDPERIKIWNARTGHDGFILHLGLLDAVGTPWEQVKNLKTLADLFAIQRNQGESRKIQLQQARAACREKSNLRALGGPSSLAHGWEDLAIFNTALVE